MLKTLRKTLKKCLYATWSFQTGFFRTSMNALFDTIGPMLRLDRLDSRRDLTTGRGVGPPQDPRPGWSTRLVGASPAARSLNSSTSKVSSEGREERLHVEGRGVLTSSRISSLDLGGLSDCPVSLPPVVSSGHRVSLSMLMPADLLSGPVTERQQMWELKLLDVSCDVVRLACCIFMWFSLNEKNSIIKLHVRLPLFSFGWLAEPQSSFNLLLSSTFTAL